MSIFNFWGKKKVNKKDTIGRHQQFLMVNKFLGQDFTGMDWQLAINKDNTEHNEIVEEITELENYIKSDIFTTHLDVLAAYNDVKNVLKKGYSMCILQNITELEDRVMGVLQNVIDYAAKSAQGQEPEFSDLPAHYKLEGILKYVDLNGLLTTGDQQMAWLILSNRISHVLSILAPEQALDYADNLRRFSAKTTDDANRLNDELTKDKLRRLRGVEDEINKGLALNKEYHKVKS